MANAYRDENSVPTLIASSNADGQTPVRVYADPTTHRLLVDLPSSSGTVTSVSVATANGLAGTVATATTTPAITLSTTVNAPALAGNGTAISAASTTGSGSTVVLATSPTLVTPALGTPTALVGTNITGTAAGLTAGTVTTNANLTGDVTSVGNATTLTNAPVIAKVLTGYVSGAGTVSATDSILQAIQKLNGNDATNANLTGVITSVGNATSIASQTGTGTKFVVDTSPTLVTPVLGVATATSINGNTFTTGTYTLTGTAAKTLNFTNTLTLSGTDSTTMTFPSTSATIARTDAANTFTGTQTVSTVAAPTNSSISVVSGTYNTIQTYTPSAAGTATLDLSKGNIHHITMPAGNITIALSNGTAGQCFIVRILQDGTGSRTVTWFTTIKWAGGSAPTLTTTASKADTMGFEITGSNTYDGFVVGQNI